MAQAFDVGAEPRTPRAHAVGISPREYFAALEKGDTRRAAQGQAALEWACRRAHHSEVYAATKDDSMRDLTQDYLTYLFAGPSGAAERSQIDSWRGVTVSFSRFIRRARRRSKTIERQQGLWRELLRDKVGKVLRTDQRFVLERGRHKLKAPSAPLERLSAEQLEARLPPLPSLLELKGNRSPEVVRRDLLADQVERIFLLTDNRPRHARELLDPIARSLEPAPIEAVRAGGTRGDGRDPIEALSNVRLADQTLSSEPLQPSEALMESSLPARMEALAQRFVGDAPPRRVQIGYLRHSDGLEWTLGAIAKRMQTSIATADRESSRFRDDLNALIVAEGLNPDEVSMMLPMIWKMCGVEAFQDPGVSP